MVDPPHFTEAMDTGMAYVCHCFVANLTRGKKAARITDILHESRSPVRPEMRFLPAGFIDQTSNAPVRLDQRKTNARGRTPPTGSK